VFGIARLTLAVAAFASLAIPGDAVAGATQATPLRSSASASLRPRSVADDQDSARILEAAQALFDAMEAADQARLSGLLLPGTIVTSQRFAADGAVTLRRTPALEWIDTQRVPGRIVERMWSPTILRRGPIAVVWTPYSLDVAGQRTHCGIDSFEFVKVESAWKIASITYTVEPSACAEFGAP